MVVVVRGGKCDDERVVSWHKERSLGDDNGSGDRGGDGERGEGGGERGGRGGDGGDKCVCNGDDGEGWVGCWRS